MAKQTEIAKIKTINMKIVKFKPCKITTHMVYDAFKLNLTLKNQAVHQQNLVLVNKSILFRKDTRAQFLSDPWIKKQLNYTPEELGPVQTTCT